MGKDFLVGASSRDCTLLVAMKEDANRTISAGLDTRSITSLRRNARNVFTIIGVPSRLFANILADFTGKFADILE